MLLEIFFQKLVLDVLDHLIENGRLFGPKVRELLSEELPFVFINLTFNKSKQRSCLSRIGGRQQDLDLKRRQAAQM